MNLSTHWAIGFCVLLSLSSCASNSSLQRLERAEENFRFFEKPELMVMVDLIDSKKIPDQDRAKEEARVFDLLAPVCIKTYTERLYSGIDQAAKALTELGDDSATRRLPAYAKALDDFYSDCIAAYGATGYNFMQTQDGREFRIPEYLSAVFASVETLKDARSQVKQEEQASAELLGMIALSISAGMATTVYGNQVNPDQIYIGNYRKYDGTVVQGHWRTVPNTNCFDNINRCR